MIEKPSKSLIFLLMFFAIFITTIFHINDGINGDEIYTVKNLQAFNNGTFFSEIQNDSHPPLYFIIQGLWDKIYDNLIFWRALNVLLFFLSSVIFYKLALLHFDEEVSGVLALLFASCPLLTHHILQLRMYSLAILLATLSSYLFMKRFYAKRTDSHNWANRAVFPLLVVNILGIYTHYYFVFIMIAQCLFYLVNKGNLYFITSTFLSFLALPPLLFLYKGQAAWTNSQNVHFLHSETLSSLVHSGSLAMWQAVLLISIIFFWCGILLFLSKKIYAYYLLIGLTPFVMILMGSMANIIPLYMPPRYTIFGIGLLIFVPLLVIKEKIRKARNVQIANVCMMFLIIFCWIILLILNVIRDNKVFITWRIS